MTGAIPATAHGEVDVNREFGVLPKHPAIDEPAPVVVGYHPWLSPLRRMLPFSAQSGDYYNCRCGARPRSR